MENNDKETEATPQTDPSASSVAPPPSGHKPPKTKAQIRRKVMTRFSLFLLAVAILLALYWFFVLRNEQETDDAYVGGDIVAISSQVQGTVTTIMAGDTDFVIAGQMLVRLDPSDTRLAFERASAELAQAVRQTRTLVTGNQQLAAQVAQRRADLNKAEGDLKRRQSAIVDGGIGQEELQHARDAVAAARAALTATEQQLKANRELVLADSAAQHPQVAAAAAMVRERWLAMKRTEIISPMSGQVAKRSVQLGAQIAPGAPLMAVIPLDTLWVDANFKENQLRDLRIGQPVTLRSDLYGSSVTYHGKVAGLSAGTGSAFSLLPPQNATGNWIKVVQRVPVRITLDPKELREHPLRIGLSMVTTVDTADQSGPVLASKPRLKPVLQATVYDQRLKDVDAVVNDIIQQNMSAVP